MAKRSSSDADSLRGFGDVAGIVFMGFSALLLVALFSYDPHDVARNGLPVNEPIHNWIGSFGAWMGYYFLLWFGLAAFILPVLTFFLGLGCFFEAFAYLRRRWLWLVAFMICGTGLLDLHGNLTSGLTERLLIPAGGLFGIFLNDFLFGYFGRVGATILFLMLYFISLLYLTNFRLGVWIRKLAGRGGEVVADAQESLLQRKAQQLKEREEQLRREVEQARRAGFGADGLPLPAPEVRDLSVPVKRSRKARKSEREDEEADEAIEEPLITIPREEVVAASTSDILGGDNPFAAKPAEEGLEPDEKESAEQAEEEGPETGEEGAEAEEETEPAPVAAPKPGPTAKVRPVPKRKPVAVASVPMIGDYKLPSLELLNHPDPNLKPTESKEELMAKARLMQQTLAQFGIEVEPGDITKGPTITRYELHPAPGVKLEKIQSLSNNLAAALKAGAYQHPGPRARQKLSRRRGAQPGQDQGDCARPAGS